MVTCLTLVRKVSDLSTALSNFIKNLFLPHLLFMMQIRESCNTHMYDNTYNVQSVQ